MHDTLVDIHCHVLPYVDDGAAVRKDALTLLDSQYRQGVRFICLTPHLRSGMFESSDEEITRQFIRMKEIADSRFSDLEVFLSREYHCDKLLRERLKTKKVLPLGSLPGEGRGGRALLIEFSSRHSKEQVYEYIELVKDYEFVPVVAHVERYPAFASKDQVRGIIQSGAKIQVNAGSVLGREGFKRKHFVRGLLKEGLVDIIASDCHDPMERPCELGSAHTWIASKCGAAYARRVFYENPLEMLNIG